LKKFFRGRKPEVASSKNRRNAGLFSELFLFLRINRPNVEAGIPGD